MLRNLGLILMLIPLWGNATHIIGGMMVMKWLGGNSYQLSVHIIRDCNSGFAVANDGSIMVGLFEKGTDSLKTNIEIQFDKQNIDTIKVPNNCIKKYNICSQIVTYTKIINIDSTIYNHAAGYYLSWQRCCRKGSIINLVNSGSAGLCLYLEVPNFSLIKNSSPIYQYNPSLIVSNGIDFSYNFNFWDQDNDRLKYSLITPLNGFLDRDNPVSLIPKAGPYPSVALANGYSNANLIGGIKALEIDSNTGTITGKPNKSGVFLISVLVEEFRNGQKIGEVRLELEINVLGNSKPAPELILASLDNTQIHGDIITMHTPDLLFFNIYASTIYDSIYLQLELPDSMIQGYLYKPIFKALSSGYRNAASWFGWNTYCGMQDSGKPIPLVIKAYDNDCPVSKIISKTIWLKISDRPVLKGPNEVCLGAQDIEFSLPNNLSANSYNWTLPSGVMGFSTTNKLIADFDNTPLNGNILVSGKNACGDNFTINHLILTAAKPEKPTISLWGLNIHSSIEFGNQWFRNESPVLGEIDKYIDLKANGRYYTIINWLGCKSDPSEPIDITFITGGDKVIKLPLPQVVPNPFSQSITLTNPLWESDMEFFVLNNLGQTMVQGKMSRELNIPTECFPSGLYILMVKSENTFYNLKLIKE